VRLKTIEIPTSGDPNYSNNYASPEKVGAIPGDASFADPFHYNGGYEESANNENEYQSIHIHRLTF